ncbi:MAG: BTAD domain-containing putative transcriptional regulator, partial [Candidatus Xenobia bacterium]
VRLSDSSGTLSRRHALLSYRGGQVFIRDLSSTGTRVGGVTLVPGEEVVLPDECPVGLGEHVMISIRSLQPGHHRAPVPTPPPPRPSTAGEALTVVTLGRALVWVFGREVPDSAWQTRKALELLIFLAHQGGKAVDADRLSTTLWSASESISRTTLQSTVSRLRRALKAASPAPLEPVVHVNGLYGLNPAIRMTVDSRQLEELSIQARQMNDTAQRCALLETCTSLYEGPFLEGWTGEWIELLRTRLEQIFMESLEGLGRCYEAQHDVERALVTYQRLLDLDPGREGAHAGQIRCLLMEGRRDEAVRRCILAAQQLRRLLHISPGPEIHALYRQLVEEEAFDSSRPAKAEPLRAPDRTGP